MMRSSARKTAGWFFALAVILVLASAYVALVYHGDLDLGADFVSSIAFGAWIAFFAVALAFCFLVLLILFLSRTQAATEEPAIGKEITITCRDCSRDYVITDTGERPLLHACPHCGYTDQYPSADAPMPEPVTAEPEPLPLSTVAGGPESLVVHCPSCGANFDTAYTEERPLVLSCSSCGKRGILRANAPMHPAQPDPGAAPA